MARELSFYRRRAKKIIERIKGEIMKNFARRIATLLLGVMMVGTVVMAEGEDLTASARQAMKEGSYETAAELASKEVENNPENWRAYYIIGRAMSENGKSEEAIAAYEKSLEINKSNFWALNNLGLLYIRSGNLESAKKVLESATQHSSATPCAFNNLGIVYERLGMNAEAVAAYEKGLELDPEYEKMKVNLERVSGKEMVAESK